jgi:hypothetical protein
VVNDVDNKTTLGLLIRNNYFRIPFYKYPRKNEIKQSILEIAASGK